jgi:hypothetical protein
MSYTMSMLSLLSFNIAGRVAYKLRHNIYVYAYARTVSERELRTPYEFDSVHSFLVPPDRDRQLSHCFSEHHRKDYSLIWADLYFVYTDQYSQCRLLESSECPMPTRRCESWPRRLSDPSARHLIILLHLGLPLAIAMESFA